MISSSFIKEIFAFGIALEISTVSSSACDWARRIDTLSTFSSSSRPTGRRGRRGIAHFISQYVPISNRTRTQTAVVSSTPPVILGSLVKMEASYENLHTPPPQTSTEGSLSKEENETPFDPDLNRKVHTWTESFTMLSGSVAGRASKSTNGAQ